MNLNIINSFIFMLLVLLVDAARINYRNRSTDPRLAADTFGARTTETRSAGQIKRDTSLSYAATNIDSKEGTRVKTITVIKNHSGKNNGKLAINPELHKSPEWADAFRDNFDTYGPIPDVPNIDDLFEFEKKKPKAEEDNKNNAAKTTTPNPKQKPKPKSKEVEMMDTTPATKPVEEKTSAEEETTTQQAVQKIQGDAELLPTLKKNQTKSSVAHSQSLGMSKALTRERLTNSNYTSSEEDKDIHFEKYIVQERQKGYDYLKACVPGQELSENAYRAPSFTKKTKLLSGSQNNTVNIPINFARPNYSVNSILPPLQSNSNTQQSNVNLGFTPTSQRPYLAPNVWNNYNGNALSTLRPLYRNDINFYRGNTYALGSGKRVNAARTRGLRF